MKTFRSDNGGEFLSAAFAADLADAGIERQLSAPYAHQQNGKAKRVIRTIEGRMYAMLAHSSVILSRRTAALDVPKGRRINAAGHRPVYVELGRPK